MAKIRIEINGRTYEMVTEDGQETHVASLGEDIAKRVKNIAHQVGQVGEGRLLIMAALQLADEQQASKSRIEQLESLAKDTTASKSALNEARTYVADVYGDLADKIETLIASLD